MRIEQNDRGVKSQYWNKQTKTTANHTIQNISTPNQEKIRQKVFFASLYLATNLAVLDLIRALGS
jgi:hypothetical protein